MGSATPTTVDQRIAAWAARRHGVVARGELHALGVRDGAIRVRLRRGNLHREHPGVYSVGLPARTRRARWLAAVLAVGGDARTSELTSAGLLGLRPEGDGVVHITASSTPRAPVGTVVHRSRRLGSPTVRDSIPCTGVERTIADLAAHHGVDEARRAWRVADARRLIVPARMRAELVPGRPGTRALRELLEEHLAHGTPRTVQEFEDRAADALRPPVVPRPEFNAPLVAEGRAYRVDALWRPERVVLEFDSWIWHGTPEAHARDARRALDLQLAGWTVVRATWVDLTVDLGTTLDRLGRLLRARGLEDSRLARRRWEA